MARRKASKGFKFRSVGIVGALAVGLAGGGYYIGKNGPPVPEKLAALIPAEKPAQHAAHDAKAPESPSVKLADKTELGRLLKGAETKLIATIRAEPEKRARAAKAETSAKPESKAEPKAVAKAPSKTQVAKAETTPQGDAAPLPPARIPNVASVDTAPTATITEPAPRPEATSSEGAQNGSAPLVASLTGKGIPTSEDNKMRLSVGFANRTGKPIRAFEGVLKFTDRNDHSLFSSKISVSALIAEGGSINWDERVDPDKLDAKGKKLVDAEKESLKAVFAPKKIFFVDGSVQQFGAKGERVALR